MAAAEFTLDNETDNDIGMSEQCKTFLKRKGPNDKKDEQGVMPARIGEWILFTKDFSKKAKELRAQWVCRPSSPGSPGDHESDAELKEAVEEALFAMKCLLNGKKYTPGVENKDAADVFDSMEGFEFSVKGKKDKCKKGKGLPSFMLINCGDAIIGVATMDMNKVSPQQRMEWSQVKEQAKKSFTELKEKCFVTFDGMQNINTQKVLDLAQSQTITV